MADARAHGEGGRGADSGGSSVGSADGGAFTIGDVLRLARANFETALGGSASPRRAAGRGDVAADGSVTTGRSPPSSPTRRGRGPGIGPGPGPGAGDAYVDAVFKRLARAHGVANLPWPEGAVDQAVSRLRAAFASSSDGAPLEDADVHELHDPPLAKGYAPSWLLACATAEHVGERAVVPSTLCRWVDLGAEGEDGGDGDGGGAGGPAGGSVPDLSAARPMLAEMWRGMCALLDGDPGARVGRPAAPGPAPEAVAEAEAAAAASHPASDAAAGHDGRATDAEAHTLRGVAGGTEGGVWLAHLPSERMLRAAVRRLAAKLGAAVVEMNTESAAQLARENARADEQLCLLSLRRHVFGPADVASRLKLDAERTARAATAQASRELLERVCALETEKAMLGGDPSCRRRRRRRRLGGASEGGLARGASSPASAFGSHWDPSELLEEAAEASPGAAPAGGPSPLSRASSSTLAQSAARGTSWARDIAARQRLVREREAADPERRTVDAIDAEIEALREAHAQKLKGARAAAARALRAYSASPLCLFDVSSVRLVDADALLLLSVNGSGLLRWLRRTAVALRAESLVATSMARVPVDAQDMSTDMVRAAPAYAGDALTPFSARGDTILMLGMCASPTLFGFDPKDVRSLSWRVYETASGLGQAQLEAAADGKNVALLSAEDTALMAAHMATAAGRGAAAGGAGARQRQRHRRRERERERERRDPPAGVDWRDGMMAMLHAAHLSAMYASDASRLRTALILNHSTAVSAVEEARGRRDADADAQRRADAELRKAEALYELMSELCDLEAALMGRDLGQRHEELIAWVVMLYRQIVRAPTVHLLHLVARSAEARSAMAHLVAEMRQRCAEAGVFRYAARASRAEYERAASPRRDGAPPGPAGAAASPRPPRGVASAAEAVPSPAETCAEAPGGAGADADADADADAGQAHASTAVATGVRLRGAGGRPLELRNGRRVVMVGEELGDAMERCVLRDVQFNAAVLAHIAHHGMLCMHRPHMFDDLRGAGLPMPGAGRADADDAADAAVASWLASLSALRAMLSALLRMCAAQAKMASGWDDLFSMVQEGKGGGIATDGGDGGGSGSEDGNDESVEELHDVFLRTLAPACDNARIAGVHHAGHLLVAAAAVEQRTAEALYDPLATRVPAPSLVRSWEPSTECYMQTVHGESRAWEAAVALRRMAAAASGERRREAERRLRSLQLTLQRTRGRPYAEIAGLSEAALRASLALDARVRALLPVSGPTRGEGEGGGGASRSGDAQHRRRRSSDRCRVVPSVYSTSSLSARDTDYGAEFRDDAPGESLRARRDTAPRSAARGTGGGEPARSGRGAGAGAAAGACSTTDGEDTLDEEDDESPGSEEEDRAREVGRRSAARRGAPRRRAPAADTGAPLFRERARGRARERAAVGEYNEDENESDDEIGDVDGGTESEVELASATDDDEEGSPAGGRVRARGPSAGAGVLTRSSAQREATVASNPHERMRRKRHRRGERRRPSSTGGNTEGGANKGGVYSDVGSNARAQRRRRHSTRGRA